MTGKLLFILLLSLLILGYAFAGENEAFPGNTVTLFSSIFGQGLQYEYQFHSNFSAGGRFEYKAFENISSIAVHGFARYYPYAGAFFIDGMLGYGNIKYYETPLTHHFSCYGRLGWRIDFGKPGGFVLEPSFGFFRFFGNNNIPKLNVEPSHWILAMALAGEAMVRLIYSGGPVFTIAAGYRF